jgi:glycoprotein endo-alpha-1,2-mannosidase
MLRRAIFLSLAALLLSAGPAAARETAVSIFFYPWYGTPARDGAYQHWQQNGHQPPVAIASAFYPARGPYSSTDALVLAAQMREIAAAGIDQIATSWWGWGSLEDLRLPSIIAAAQARGLDVAVHIEPYPERTPASVTADVEHLRELGITDFYVYDPLGSPAPDWATALATLEGVRVFAQTGLVGFAAAAGFDGVYTYDVLVHSGDKLARLCEQARRKELICAPSVGPGYDARRAMGDERVKSRRNGRTYDAMWRAALAAGPERVTITSYNEWHEGTQIEPARAKLAPDGSRYEGYDGAWGLRGRAAERAYLTRTAFWSRRLAALFRTARLPDVADTAG